MTTLKEREAVEYLWNARSCISEYDNFPPFKLLSRMLEIEASFMERLLVKGGGMARVTIHSSGFPELDSWYDDLQNAFREYKTSRSERAKTMLPLFQPYMDASGDRVLETAEKISGYFDSDNSIAQAMAGLDEKQTGYLQKLKNQITQPFYYEPSFPGVMFMKSVKSPFQKENFETHLIRKEDSGISYKLGVKFVENTPGLPKNTPAILFVCARPEKISIHELTPYRDNEDDDFIILEDYFCSQHANKENFWALGRKDGGRRYISRGAERLLRNLHPALSKAYLSIDITALTPTLKDEVSVTLAKMQDFIQRLSGFMNSYAIEAKKIGSQRFLEANKEMVAEMNTIFNSISDDSFRMVFQLAQAEALTQIQKEAEKLAQNNNQAEEGGWWKKLW